jgi:hypothetical protein
VFNIRYCHLNISLSETTIEYAFHVVLPSSK